MTRKLLLITPLLVLLCFGLVGYVPTDELVDSDLLPNSALPLFALLGIGAIAFLFGTVSGIVLARRRKEPRWYFLTVSTLLAVVASLFIATIPIVESGFATPKSGVVVDRETGNPVEGAYVVVRWYQYHAHRFYVGHSGGGGTRCLFRAVVRTDANGRFDISPPEGETKVSWVPSIEYDNRYFWGLRVYSPKHALAKFTNRRGDDDHPKVHGAQLDPITLAKDSGTPRDRALDLTGIPLTLTCQCDSCKPLVFTRDIYSEAFPLTCTQGGLAAAKALAELRLQAPPAMPALPGDIENSLQGILKRYHPTESLSEDDARQVCSLLSQLGEAQP